MKQLLFILLFVPVALLAQDYIVPEKGDTIKNCQVWNNIDGRLYYTKEGTKQSIHIQEVICYTKQGELIVGGSRLAGKVKVNSSGTTSFNKYFNFTNNLKTAGYCFIGAGAMTALTSIIIVASGSETDLKKLETYRAATYVTAGIGTVLYFVGSYSLIEASRTFENGTAMHFKLAPAGASLCLKF